MIKDKLKKFKDAAIAKASEIIDATIIDEPQSLARYEICSACPHLTKFSGQCTKCGCFMKAKVKLKGASCPIGKW